MTEDKTLIPKKKPIDFGKIYHVILNYKRLYFIVLPVTFILAVFVMFSIPNYYICTVKLSPELSNRSSSTSDLVSLASSFGVKLGSGMGNSDALFPTLYPDLIYSVDFKTSLLKVKVHPSDTKEEYTYYDYIRNVKKKPWWSNAITSVRSLFDTNNQNDTDTINPRQLTKKQEALVRSIGKDISCQVDKKTMVIILSAKDTDPVVCTTMADSTMALLQKYITDYRTSKARVDLEYNKKLLAEAKADYEKASRAYASFADANLHTFQERISQKKAEMETDVLLKRTIYQQVSAQLQQAEMKLQEDTPAFAVIQASTIPVRKAGPSRLIVCLLFVFLAFLVTSCYALYKEDELLPLIGF